MQLEARKGALLDEAQLTIVLRAKGEAGFASDYITSLCNFHSCFGLA
jgi:hypothetical protein